MISRSWKRCATDDRRHFRPSGAASRTQARVALVAFDQSEKQTYPYPAIGAVHSVQGDFNALVVHAGAALMVTNNTFIRNPCYHPMSDTSSRSCGRSVGQPAVSHLRI